MQSTSNAQSDLIGSAEACAILTVDRSTLTRWAANGTLPAAYKNPGSNGAYVFHRSAVERLGAELANARANDRAVAAS